MASSLQRPRLLPQFLNCRRLVTTTSLMQHSCYDSKVNWNRLVMRPSMRQQTQYHLLVMTGSSDWNLQSGQQARLQYSKLNMHQACYSSKLNWNISNMHRQERHYLLSISIIESLFVICNIFLLWQVWILGWLGLVVILTVGTFGLWWSILIFINAIFCIAG